MLQKVSICGVNTSGLPLLSAKEQTELMIKLKSGDGEARDKFIIGNMRLVLSLVKRFWSKNANADDVFQAGCVGLIKAIDNFDMSVGVKFSTYAVPMILGEIKRFIRDGNSLRVSRSIRDTAYRILKVREELGEFERASGAEREKEGGDILFAAVNVLRMAGIDPEVALNGTTARFIRRFMYVEQKMREAGLELKAENIDVMEKFYRESKKVTG